MIKRNSKDSNPFRLWPSYVVPNLPIGSTVSFYILSSRTHSSGMWAKSNMNISLSVRMSVQMLFIISQHKWRSLCHFSQRECDSCIAFLRWSLLILRGAWGCMFWIKPRTRPLASIWRGVLQVRCVVLCVAVAGWSGRVLSEVKLCFRRLDMS